MFEFQVEIYEFQIEMFEFRVEMFRLSSWKLIDAVRKIRTCRSCRSESFRTQPQDLITSFIQDSVDKHIESKISRSVSSVPWITPEIRRMDELGFYVPSTVFQSFRDDGRVNMKGSVQWRAV